MQAGDWPATGRYDAKAGNWQDIMQFGQPLERVNMTVSSSSKIETLFTVKIWENALQRQEEVQASVNLQLVYNRSS